MKVFKVALPGVPYLTGGHVILLTRPNSIGRKGMIKLPRFLAYLSF